MTKCRCWCAESMIVSLAISLILAIPVHGQTAPSSTSDGSRGLYDCPAPPIFIAKRKALHSQIYPLTDLGQSTEFCQWVADTIPMVVAPSSWQDMGGDGTLRYYAPRKIMVVYQSNDVQAKISEFLANMKKTVSTVGQSQSSTAKKTKPSVWPATHVMPRPYSPVTTVPPSNPYPVPSTNSQPKHLFHFIIRYEGDGVVGPNIAEIIKSQNQPSTPAITAQDSLRPGLLGAVGGPLAGQHLKPKSSGGVTTFPPALVPKGGSTYPGTVMFEEIIQKNAKQKKKKSKKKK